MPDDSLKVNDDLKGATDTAPLPATRDVIFLEPGGEQAQKIAKAMGSQTAGDILQLLKTGPKTSTEVTDQLGIPMGTAKYHIENLLDAGLIEVTKTKYSVKGREVKVYGLKDQLLIVTPKVTNVRALLLKYASLFGIVVIATVVIGTVLQILSHGTTSVSLTADLDKSGIPAVLPNGTPAQPVAGYAGANEVGLSGINASRALVMKETETGLAPPPCHDTVCSQVICPGEIPSAFPLQEVLIAFFLGGCVVIAVLVIYELVQRRRNKNT